MDKYDRGNRMETVDRCTYLDLYVNVHAWHSTSRQRVKGDSSNKGEEFFSSPRRSVLFLSGTCPSHFASLFVNTYHAESSWLPTREKKSNYDSFSPCCLDSLVYINFRAHKYALTFLSLSTTSTRSSSSSSSSVCEYTHVVFEIQRYTP